MPTKTRRVVTGNDANGKATIVSDSLIESQPGKRGDVHVTSLWMTESSPPALNGADPVAKGIPPLPVHDGMTFRFMEIGPGTEPHMHRTETIDYIICLEDGRQLKMLRRHLMNAYGLTPEQFRVLREHGTERAFTSPLDGEKRQGTFRCAGCGLDLFSSEAKFNSGTGWPSFFAPIAEDAKVTVAGKSAEPSALKAGMVCDVVHLGNGDAARDIACR